MTPARRRSAPRSGALPLLRGWLRTHGPPERPEDDRVIVGGHDETRLSELVERRGTIVAFPVELLDIVLVDR